MKRSIFLSDKQLYMFAKWIGKVPDKYLAAYLGVGITYVLNRRKALRIECAKCRKDLPREAIIDLEIRKVG